jgi:uncharacterized protein (DUF58 family)
MNREKIRLRPTGLWLLFGPILGCMWVAAVNYSNNLVYAILYLVASLTFVSLFHTRRNLAAVEIEHVRLHPAFAGEEVRVEIHVRNGATVPAYGLSFLRLETGRRWRDAVPLLGMGGRGLTVPPGDFQVFHLRFPAGRRGHHRLEALVVRTNYPFGLVDAGFRVPLARAYFVYPAPRGDAEFPALRGGGGGVAVSVEAGDDFAGVRPYQPGESLRHVDWKAHARGRPLSVKQFAGGDGRELWLDGEDLAALPLEDRLSQLARWVVQAEKEEVPYGFSFDGLELAPALGPDHARRALEVLAVAT